jgi:hypothetical protein
VRYSNFTNNSAHVNGGVIRFTFYKPNITENNTFTDNMAVYGEIMASYAVEMRVEPIIVRRNL